MNTHRGRTVAWMSIVILALADAHAADIEPAAAAPPRFSLLHADTTTPALSPRPRVDLRRDATAAVAPARGLTPVPRRPAESSATAARVQGRLGLVDDGSASARPVIGAARSGPRLRTAPRSELDRELARLRDDAGRWQPLPPVSLAGEHPRR